MEAWQRIGTYAAGLALDFAGVKGKTDIFRMDMIVAAGGGERDLTADSAILSGLLWAQNPAGFLNERLMSDLRPTLFLAQLSNLLAGNISIVHGVTGSSRTFMGEESAGVDAVHIALARITSGQSDIALVGGSANAERHDMLMLYEFGIFILKERYGRCGSALRRWLRPGLARCLPGYRGSRLCGKARGKAAGEADGRAVGPVATHARQRDFHARRVVGQDQGAAEPWTRLRFFPGPLVLRQRPAKSANSSRPTAILPFAPPGPISAMGWSRNSYECGAGCSRDRSW